MELWASSASLWHTTFARNYTAFGLYDDYYGNCSTAELTNTILVSHTLGVLVTSGNTATLESTLWGSDGWANETDWGGEGTIITGSLNYWGDPDFVDPGAHDYHIGSGSAAIDQGLYAGIEEDMDGETRPSGAGYDIGADEYVP
jgi:hypothetical protein